MNSNKHLEYFIIIANKKDKDKLLELLIKHDAKVIETMYGRGTAETGLMKGILGFLPEVHKIVITSLILNDNAQILINILKTEYEFNKPNTGFAFSLPIEGISY